MKLFNYVKNLFGLGEAKSNKCCENGNCNCQTEAVKKGIDVEMFQSPVTEEIPVKEKQIEEKPQETKPTRKPRKPRPNTAQGERGHGASDPKKKTAKRKKPHLKRKENTTEETPKTKRKRKKPLNNFLCLFTHL